MKLRHISGALMVLAAACLVVVQGQSERAVAADQRPNIVLITTDDQRADDLRHMPYTRSLLGGNGYTFTRALSPHPLCCPARAEWLTGQYAHNNGVRHNGGPHGGYGSLVDPTNHVGSWLQRSGYRTAMVGKFMNGYRARGNLLPGWDHWNPTVRRIYAYSGTTFFDDGARTFEPGHVDDVTFDYAADYVREFADEDRPFFVWASGLAPHGGKRSGTWVGAIPAKRHRGDLRGVSNPALRHPGYNVRDGFSVKAGTDGDVGQVKRKLSRREGNKVHRARVESLLAVDEGVRDLVEALRSTGELDNTYVVFTSDNGFMLGEHRLLGKNFLYQEALRVPLVVRVPGVGEARRSQVPVTAVDVVPTFVDVADAGAGRAMDGESFLPLLHDQPLRWRKQQLVQAGAGTTTGWSARGVRTARWAYARNLLTGREQLLDLRKDPFEMRNLADRRRMRPVLRDMRRRLARLADCAGQACR